jgi:hypothetical protein
VLGVCARGSKELNGEGGVSEFLKALVLAIAPSLVEHIAAPLIGRELERRDRAKRKRKGRGVSAETFAGYVEEAKR